MTDKRYFCLTLDLENDWYFDEPGYDHLTFEYLDEFIELIDRLGVPVSIFVVGKTIEKYPEKIDRLDAELDCEFHLHSYQHDTDKEYGFRREIRRGKAAFRDHFGHDPEGYRAPQGNIEPEEFPILEEEGFRFDSSVFPSYRPGVYSNLDAPLEPYIPDPVDELIEIPIGATAIGRVPTGHSYIKLFGRPLLYYLERGPLPELLVYNVHLQDLYRTESHDRLPIIKRFIYSRNMENSDVLLANSFSKLASRDYEACKISEMAH